MMRKISAGILLFRERRRRIEALLAHPGGPYFRSKDLGAWTIPKGEPGEEEDLLEAAKREFAEELGFAPVGRFYALTPVVQKGGKVVHAWAIRGDCDPERIVSNTFTIEWPPRSGREVEFPEVDRVEFFDLKTARLKINPAQAALLDELEERLGQQPRM